MKAPFGSLDFDASSTCSMVVLAISQSVPGPFKYHQCIYKLYSITTYIIYTYVVYSMIWMLQANWYNGSTPFTLSPYITNPSPWLLSKTRRAPYNKFQQTWQNVLVVSCVWTPSGVGGGEQMKGGMQESRILGIQKWWANLEHKNCTTSLGTGTHPTGDLFVLMILGHGVQLVGIDLDLM